MLFAFYIGLLSSCMFLYMYMINQNGRELFKNNFHREVCSSKCITISFYQCVIETRYFESLCYMLP